MGQKDKPSRDPKDSSLVWLLELETALRLKDEARETEARNELSRLGYLRIDIDRATLMRRTGGMTRQAQRQIGRTGKGDQ